MALAKLAAVFPLELALHALVVLLHPPYLVSVAVLTVSTTVMVIWVVEPAAMRLLRSWLHAPALRGADRPGPGEVLWRVRTVLPDRPGALEGLTSAFADRRLNILGVHVHTLEREVLDEFVLAAPASVTSADLRETVLDAGGRAVRVSPTTAEALADGQTKALTIAIRVAADPDELAWGVAELLGGRLRAASSAAAERRGQEGDLDTLELPRSTGSPIVVSRPGDPFTPTERARARRLAELSELSRAARLAA